MHATDKANQASTVGLIVFSMTALAVVAPFWVGMLTGHLPPPDTDEGTGAHIFQLSLAALLPIGLVFLATADWSRPVRALRCGRGARPRTGLPSTRTPV